MLRSIPGVYREGVVELAEKPSDISEANVIVTFLPASMEIDLPSRGIDTKQAADLRVRLSAFAEDWNHPEMDAYDAL